MITPKPSEWVAQCAEIHEMIATLLCEQMRKHSVAMQKRFPNENRRASNVDLIGDKCSHHVKLRMYNEKGLKELDLPVRFLQTNNIVVLAQALWEKVLPFSRDLEAVEPRSSLVFHDATQRPASRICTQMSPAKGLL